jgi:hypothetical protein
MQPTIHARLATAPCEALPASECHRSDPHQVTDLSRTNQPVVIWPHHASLVPDQPCGPLSGEEVRDATRHDRAAFPRTVVAARLLRRRPPAGGGNGGGLRRVTTDGWTGSDDWCDTDMLCSGVTPSPSTLSGSGARAALGRPLQDEQEFPNVSSPWCRQQPHRVIGVVDKPPNPDHTDGHCRPCAPRGGTRPSSPPHQGRTRPR